MALFVSAKYRSYFFLPFGWFEFHFSAMHFRASWLSPYWILVYSQAWGASSLWIQRRAIWLSESIACTNTVLFGCKVVAEAWKKNSGSQFSPSTGRVFCCSNSFHMPCLDLKAIIPGSYETVYFLHFGFGSLFRLKVSATNSFRAHACFVLIPFVKQIFTSSSTMRRNSSDRLAWRVDCRHVGRASHVG